ncbi:MAG: winged helix DNA-binding domain-containing protein [Myxococcaceae bacterium]|nr:winged helix DNA-binding domain-containing protein [Myxococcaceae bacterium]MBH2006286.1 winged helix DNA-binding domain-containing protein [Myxococcaceae bacterium]
MNARTEKFSQKAIQLYHHRNLIHFNDQETLIEAISNMLGLCGANPIAFLSIHARRPNLRLNDLDEAIFTDRTLLRANVFRNSLSLVNSQDFGIYYRALHQPLKTSGLEKLAPFGILEADIERAEIRLQESNFGNSKTHEEIIDILYPNQSNHYSLDAQKLLIRKLCELGIIVRTFHKGWKGNDFSYALMKRWIPHLKLNTENQESARVQLIRKYIRCYGPVSKQDILWWTGLNINQVNRSLSNLKRELTVLSSEVNKEELWFLKDNLSLLASSQTTHSFPIFLPPWDPFTTGWANRKRTIKSEYSHFVYDQLGNASSCIVDQGRIVGVWQFRDSQEHIFEYHLFESYQELQHDCRYAAERYANQLARISGSKVALVYQRPLPEPLPKRPAGSFFWPVGKEPPFKTNNPELLQSPLERRIQNPPRKPYLHTLSHTI